MTPPFLRPFRRFAAAALAAAAFLSAPSATPATLPIDVTVLQGAAAQSPAAAKGSAGDVVFLVLDHSGSMNETDDRENSRWDALLDSLETTLRSLPAGTEVRVEWIESSFKKDRHGNLERHRGRLVLLPARPSETAVLSGPDSRKDIWKRVSDAGAPDDSNGTPLFETLEKVSAAARDLIRGGRRVAVVVFSDGESNEHDKAERKRRLDRDYGPLFSNDRFNACLVWINPKDDPPEKVLGVEWNRGYKAPPAVYSVSAEPAVVSIANPLSGGEAHGVLSLSFNVPADVWAAMEGKPAQLEVRRIGEGGKTAVLGVATLPVRRGAQTCRISVPDAALSSRSGLRLALSNIPSPEGALVNPPPPVGLLLVEPDRLSLSLRSPSAGTVVREGSDIEFSATATPGAEFEWTFGDGSPAEKGAVRHHAYRNEGRYEAKVVARKKGFAPADGLSAAVSVEVVHAEVVLEPFDAPVVGREAAFSCRGIGRVSGYTWLVDGEEVAGTDSASRDSSKLAWTFRSTGRHTVQVRAGMDRLGFVLSEKKEFDVGAAPYLRIDEPDSGSSFAAGEGFSAAVYAEGGVSAVRWVVSGPEAKTLDASVSGNSAVARLSFDKPGEYGLKAVDAAGAAESGAIQFRILPKDVALGIDEPADGHTQETGTEMKLVASAKGVEKVRWSVEDEDKGTEIDLGEAPVGPNGLAQKAWTPRPEDGDGRRRIVARDVAGAAEPASVRVTLDTKGDIRFLEPADYLRVPFGSNVTLRAETTGAASDVRWFVDGEELPGKGEGAFFEPSRAGASERIFKVFARASMPGGGSRRTVDRTIVAFCPALEPRIDLAKKDWDIGAPVQFKLVSPAGRTGRVVWSFGDGTPDETAGATHSHAFAKAGSYEVSARAICADCGESFAAAPAAVSVHCPALCPVLTIDRRDGDSEDAAFARNRPVLMSLSYEAPGATARAEGVVWDFGDGLSVTNLDAVEHPFVDFGEKTVSVSVRCAACGKVETAKKTIRIDRKPPRAHFTICRTSSDKPAGDRIPQWRTVSLVSACTGDVAGLRWTLNGEPLPEFDDNPAPEFDCSTVGKQVFSLVALDPEGAPSEPETRSIRVYRCWLVWLLLFLAAVPTIWIWWLYSGGDPRFWTILACEKDNGFPDKEAAVQELSGAIATDLPNWDRSKKEAQVPLHQLAGPMSENWGENSTAGKAVLIIRESQSVGDGGFRPPAASLGQHPDDMSMSDYDNGALLHIVAQSPNDKMSQISLWVQIQTSGKQRTNGDLWTRIGLTVLFFGIAFVLMAVFAF